jgi:adenosine deaminase
VVSARRDDGARLDAWLSALPKAEMHLHFEGALRWSTIRELHPDGRALPDTPPWLAQACPFPDFRDFRDAFAVFRPASGTPETIERHAFEVIEDLVHLNVRYAELIVSVAFHTRRGLLAETEVWTAIAAGRARAMARYPIDVRLFVGIRRHTLPVQALAMVDRLAAFAQPRGWLDGIELHSDERLGEHRAFLDVYAHAAAAGLKLRAHAGELCGPDNVRAAVMESGVRDISHGIRAIEDPALVRELVARGVFLHVCPTSNVRLGCAASHRDHPLRALVDAGVRCTVNSDNPLLFATDIVQEYRHAVREMGFSPAAVAEFARNGFRASLLPADRVQALCAEIDTLLPEGALAWR